MLESQVVKSYSASFIFFGSHSAVQAWMVMLSNSRGVEEEMCFKGKTLNSNKCFFPNILPSFPATCSRTVCSGLMVTLFQRPTTRLLGRNLLIIYVCLVYILYTAIWHGILNPYRLNSEVVLHFFHQSPWASWWNPSIADNTQRVSQMAAPKE